MSTRESWNRWGRGVTVPLAVLALVCPAVAYDTGGTFARGTTILGLQIGGGSANNTEGHRTVSDISFLTAAPRVSYLFSPPSGAGSSGARSSRASKAGSSTISPPARRPRGASSSRCAII